MLYHLQIYYSSFADILFHSVGDLFALLIILFTMNIRFYFCFACLKGCIQKVLLIRLISNCILPIFPSRTLWFQAIHLSLESFLHLLWGMVSKTSSVWHFCECLSRFLNTTYWRGCFPPLFSCLLSRRLVAFVSVGYFWALLCPAFVPVPYCVDCHSFEV